MKVLNLQCRHKHVFEGWFGSEEDVSAQTEQGLLECPLCGDKEITRLPSAPRLNLSGAREPVVASAPALPAVPASQDAPSPEALWMHAVRHVMQNTEDVGERFAEEARRMHYGEVSQRGIRGRTTREEAEALGDEGIEVFSLPVPAALKGPLQ